MVHGVHLTWQTFGVTTMYFIIQKFIGITVLDSFMCLILVVQII